MTDNIDNLPFIFWISGSVVVDLWFNVPSIICGRCVFVFSLVCITLCSFYDNIYHEGNISKMPDFDVFFCFGM